MKPFDFCPACGTGLNQPGHEDDRECPKCGRTWYRSSSPTAGAAIWHDGQVLVTRRGMEPEKGRFDVPGGFLRAGEDVIEGLRRELREELQVEVDVSMRDCVQMVPHVYGDEGEYVLAIGFMARLVSGEPTPGDDVAEAHWISKDDVDRVDFAWEHDRDLVMKAFERAEEPTGLSPRVRR